MGAKKARKKRSDNEDTELEVGSESLLRSRQTAEEPDDEVELGTLGDDKDEPDDGRHLDIDLPVLPSASERDARAVDDLTDRIFRSVLSRYGWERHGNRIEHVGEERNLH